MLSEQDWFTKTKDGKLRINSRDIYKSLSNEIVKKLAQNLSVSEILEWIKNETSQAFYNEYLQKPEVGAMNKAIGGWNELIATSLLSEIIFEINENSNNECIAVFSMPNSRFKLENTEAAYSNFLNLFNSTDFNDLSNPLSKIRPFRDKIFMPSPDYIIVSIDNQLYRKEINLLLQYQARDPESINLYNFLKGKLHIEEIQAAVSLKTSNRPDRRYQPLFEAAMIKAIGYVLQQNWKYYMVVSDLTEADKAIFDKVTAPHGVALQEDIKLVNATYTYSRKVDLLPLVTAAIQ